MYSVLCLPFRAAQFSYALNSFCICILVASQLSAQTQVEFETDVAPLLIKRCIECHQGSDKAGGLDLTTKDGVHSGGDSGKAFDLKDPSDSLLLERIVAGEMPPEKQGRSQKLPDVEIETIRRWLKGGADWPKNRELDFFERTNENRAGRDWWSLQPIKRPEIPLVKNARQPENPIDAFILARLQSKQIEPAPQAGRRTLIRRLYFDLIGIPPSEQEIKQFEMSTDPLAWSKLVDQLLERPQYGERWGRYWLDLVRYADTSGYERDQEKPFAWKYRDWVIESFNNDMPYRQFIREQLAGDELDQPTDHSLIATGFLRLGSWNDEPNDPADYQYDRLEDLVHTTSSSFIGLTVKCARCHSHKFDAIKQLDYYRMASAFWPGPLMPSRDRKFLGGPSTEELGVEKVLGWTDVQTPPRPFYVLKNGERDQPAEKVHPAAVSFVPALEKPFQRSAVGTKTTTRRLQLAEWIADPKNPLTARVLVNRLWQHHFGKAIVRTPNNFGFLSDPPTHPKLLDFLAAEFLASGGRIKEMHRLILNSRTWAQSSNHPDYATLSNLDPTNRLWWRSERRRLDAESLRDALLAASGELDLTMGGPGFKPTVDPAALEGLSRKTQAWNPSPPAEQNRRGVYMYMKRGLLPPLMTTFDLCDPAQSCGKRDVTVSPTQALVLLNHRFVYQRSTELARKITAGEQEQDSQIRAAWSNVLSRQPSAAELVLSKQHLLKQKIQFQKLREAKIPAPSEKFKSEAAGDLKKSLVLQFRADQVQFVKDNNSLVKSVTDLSGNNHHASQTQAINRPSFKPTNFANHPALVFDGKARFFHLEGRLLESQEFTIVAVANDLANTGHREIISNWNGAAGNSVSSIFLGMTGKNKIRFSDAFVATGLARQGEPFLLTAINGRHTASLFQNGQKLKSAAALPKRRLDTAWVVGQQGNINGEYWNGAIAEIRVYDRALNDAERICIEHDLMNRYQINALNPKPDHQLTAEEQALASLCHVLMNSNEFLYVD